MDTVANVYFKNTWSTLRQSGKHLSVVHYYWFIQNAGFCFIHPYHAFQTKHCILWIAEYHTDNIYYSHFKYTLATAMHYAIGLTLCQFPFHNSRVGIPIVCHKLLQLDSDAQWPTQWNPNTVDIHCSLLVKNHGQSEWPIMRKYIYINGKSILRNTDAASHY